MIKCSKCGSIGKFGEYDRVYHYDSELIVVERRYHCGDCGRYTHTLQTYRAVDMEEEDE